MITTAAFPEKATSVAAARRFVATALAGAPDQLRQRAELLVSELATNAVRHARSAFAITVEQRDGSVRIAVDDAGAGAPVKRSPNPTEPSGRGLLIVERLADDWGVEDRPTEDRPTEDRATEDRASGLAARKTVWFELGSAK